MTVDSEYAKLVKEVARLQGQADTFFGRVKVYFKRLGLAFVGKSL